MSLLLTAGLAFALTACSPGTDVSTKKTASQTNTGTSSDSGDSGSSGSYRANVKLLPGATTVAPNGSTPLTVTGGAAPYDIVVSNPAVGSVQSNVFYAAEKDGVTNVTVKDANGQTDFVTIYVKTNLILTATPNPVRAGSTSELTVTGGLPEYTFSASKATIEDGNVFQAPDVPGTYRVTVQDGNLKTKYVDIKVTASDPLSIQPTQTTARVDGQPVSFQVTGGRQPYKKAYVYSGDGSATIENGNTIKFFPKAAMAVKIVVVDADDEKVYADITVESSIVKEECSKIQAQGFSNNVERGVMTTLNSKSVCKVALPATSEGGLWTQDKETLSCPEGWFPLQGPNAYYTISFAQIVQDYTSYWGGSTTKVTKSHNNFASVALGTECVEYCTGRNFFGKCKETRTACSVARYMACVPDTSNPIFQ